MSLFNKLAFYPSVGYNIFMEYFGGRQWYHRIDKYCILGALPLRHKCNEIIEKENIKAVLSLNESFELGHTLSKSEWNALGIDYLQIPVVDYTGVANMDQIDKAVNFINTHRQKENSIYVHCKAGRGRSALIIACYLLYHNKDLSIEEAIQKIKAIRPHVCIEYQKEIDAMNAYKKHLTQ